MRSILIASSLSAIALLSGCGGESGAKVDASQLEEVLGDSAYVPGTKDDELDISCSLPSGDGIDDRWNCTIDGRTPVSDEEEAELRTSFPDDRGVHIELAAWVTRSEAFQAGSFAAVQVDGDPLYEGGGAYFNGGCCIEDEDLGSSESAED